MIRIGISSCFLHPDSERATFSKKTLLYFEQSMAHWVMNHGAFPILLPTNSDSFDYSKILDFVDGLLLHGGADLAPCSYGEAPLSPLWPGDAIRDQYEIALYTNAKKMGLPILGICRGMQLMNVAEGGSLFQDLNTQRESTQMHRNKELYDELFHPIELKSGGLLEKIYSEDISSSTKELLRVNSVHHQGIKKLASSLISEAYCPSDGLIEAVRHRQCDPDNLESPYILGVQWHPEFMQKLSEGLSEKKLMHSFLKAIERQQASRKA